MEIEAIRHQEIAGFDRETTAVRGEFMAGDLVHIEQTAEQVVTKVFPKNIRLVADQSTGSSSPQVDQTGNQFTRPRCRFNWRVVFSVNAPIDSVQ